jgi:hypothetical protein
MEIYHSATSPAFGFSTLTTLSQFNRQRGSKANFSCKWLEHIKPRD